MAEMREYRMLQIIHDIQQVHNKNGDCKKKKLSVCVYKINGITFVCRRLDMRQRK